MYKVFINDHLIFIGEKLENQSNFDSLFQLLNSDQEELVQLLDYLAKESMPLLVYLKYDKLEEGWDTFNSAFKIIEAAGGVVQNEDEEVLMIYRLGFWDLPKGKIEKGESIQEAALREVQEECNIDGLNLGDQLDDSYHIYHHKDQWVLKRTYWFQMTAPSNQVLKPQTEEGIEKVEWVAKEQLAERSKESYASLRPLLNLPI